MKKKVLITGINGFIGRSLSSYLKNIQPRLKIVGIDQSQSKTGKQKYVFNLTDQEQLEQALVEISPDYIFHMAGGRMRDLKQLKSSNLTTTRVLFEALKRVSLQSTRVIIPGSAAEYGLLPKNIRRVNERYEPKPSADYGKVKHQQTQYALEQVSKGCDVVVARIFNIVGINTPEQLVAGRFADQITRLERKGKTGAVQTMSLEGRRDFLDIEDICSALWQIALYGRRGHIYNVCSSQSTPIESLLMEMILASKLLDVEICEQENKGFKSFDVVGSNAKLRSHTQWKSKIDLTESLRRTIQSYRKVRS